MVRLGFSRVVFLSAGFILKAVGDLLLEPSSLVVEYGAQASANCSTNSSHKGMGWEASQGGVDMVTNVTLLTWTVPSLTHWDIKPMCYMNLASEKQILKFLPVTIYKLPDTLSVSLKNCSGIEGETCLLQCDVQNVAPVQYLKVIWYRQQFLMTNSSFNETAIEPVNKIVNLKIQLSRNDDGAKYWCEAKLELGPEGLRPRLRKKSEPVSIAVQYKPVFSNDTEKMILEAGNGEIILNCTVRANPPSKYTWNVAPGTEKNELHSSSPLLSVSQPGNYTCTASNQYGEAKKLFVVIKPQSGNTFWIILGLGLLLAAVLLIIGLIVPIKKRFGNHRKTMSSAGQPKEEEVSLK
ncbi:hypothetical protein AMELA_G00211850 [Ameiurus melas]|uniref:Ig-like domain-containing protein n=1 Tax=Ameiurus melas TaxID=219545 RepID=A0A7J6A742_AMEME|nr:hypothetical protein AMELA_G00211850 [Ameiurus melas]